MIPTKLLNEIIRRAEALKESQPQTFPPVTRDFHQEEVDWALVALLGEAVPSTEVPELKAENLALERQIQSLTIEIRELKAER